MVVDISCAAKEEKNVAGALTLRARARLRVVAALSSWTRRGVGMFRGQVNPVTGRQEWAVEERDVESEDGDLSRELARSQYGDMLHDTARVGRQHQLHATLCASFA